MNVLYSLEENWASVFSSSSIKFTGFPASVPVGSAIASVSAEVMSLLLRQLLHCAVVLRLLFHLLKDFSPEIIPFFTFP